MNTEYVRSQGVVQIEHPDRVSWYQALIQQWTGQVARVFVQEDGLVAAWVMGYSSSVGMVHPAPTQVWSDTIENALDALACQVYADVEDDLALIAVSHPSPAVVGSSW